MDAFFPPSPASIQFAATLYLVMVGGVIVFQFCLMGGAPWGEVTQGGQHEGPLPRSGRIIAGVSVPILLFLGAGVASAAGMAPSWPSWTGKVALGIQTVVMILNWITRSKPERRLWGPITTVMVALAAYVVLG